MDDDGARVVGVGPWEAERGGPPPADDRLDPELLAVGDRYETEIAAAREADAKFR